MSRVDPATTSRADTLADSRAQGQTFEIEFGQYLHELRRRQGLRRRHLATDDVPANMLRKVERGELPLNRSLLVWVAKQYGADLDDFMPSRSPLIISPEAIIIDGKSQQIANESVTATLLAYLELVRSLRSDSSGIGPPGLLPLRRADVQILSAHLDQPCAVIVGRLAELMDARGDETQAMVQLYLHGAEVIGVADVAAAAGPGNRSASNVKWLN
ncbi:MAG: hypothetical protein ACR2PK_12420 [Acidimicrobiales bacterium]